MQVFEKIIKLLDQAGVKYEVLEHAPVFTSSDAAKIRDTGLANGAKALLFEADKKPILLVLPGDKKVDTSKFKKIFGVKDLSLVSRERVKELAGIEVGAIPPVGPVLNLPSYFDEEILTKEYVAFNAGRHEKSIRMLPSDLVKVVKPVLGKFTL